MGIFDNEPDCLRLECPVSLGSLKDTARSPETHNFLLSFMSSPTIIDLNRFVFIYTSRYVSSVGKSPTGLGKNENKLIK